MIRVRQSLILLLVLVTLVATGCDLGITVQEMPGETGTLVIQLKDMTRDVSINWEPEGIPMDIASYEISGAGPEGRTFAETLSDPNELVVVPNLRKGDWTITVLGLNENGIAVGEGSTEVVIVAGTTTPAHVSVREIAGEGTLSVEIAWPRAEVANPNILMTLKKSTSETTQSHSFSSKDTDIPGLATLTMDIDAGYYEVTVSIYDGPTTDINNKITGVNGTANILAGKETEGTVTFTEASLRVFGDVKIFITNDMAVPFTVNLTQDRDTTWEGQPITLNATVDLEGDYTYVWYLDGDRLEDETSQQLVLDSTTLPLGTHFIGVMASRAGVLSSALTSFVIREEPDTYFTIKFFEPDTQNLVHQINLEYNISNYEVIGNTSNYEKIIFSPLVYQHPNFINYPHDNKNYFSFYPINKPINPDEIHGSMPSNTTLAAIIIEGFNGAGQYPMVNQNDEKDEPESAAYFALMTNQIDIGMDYDLSQLDSSDTDDGYIEISQYGEIGNYLTGNITLKNVSIDYGNEYDEDNEDEYENGLLLTEYFDVVVDFSLIRGDDLNLYFSTVSFVFNGSYVIDYPVIVGETYYNLFDWHGDETLLGWSTEPDGKGTVYNREDPFVVPEEPITLYAILSDSPVAF